EQNPVLEENPELELAQKEPDGEFDAEEYPQDPAAPDAEWESQIERLTQLDQEWKDYFSETALPSVRHSKDDEERRQHMFDSLTTSTSLQEELRDQVRLSDLDASHYDLADMLIGNIDEGGFLKASTNELIFSTNAPKETIERVVELIQSFDPPGVGARDLRECLMLQLERIGKQQSLEYRILDRCFSLLGKRKFPDIARDLGQSLDAVVQAAKRISHLNPRPGGAFRGDTETYVTPEVFITRAEDGEYQISVNNDHIPRIRISNTYKDLLSTSSSATDLKEYIREKIRSGKFLIKSIDQRQQTITKIAHEILRRQRDFF
ncbi:MAG: RNA polymerase sigma-54 factor, partial [Verrucomicrobiota bacterium]